MSTGYNGYRKLGLAEETPVYRYKVSYVEPDCEEYDGGRHYTGNELRLRVHDRNGREIECVDLRLDEAADVFDYVLDWEDDAHRPQQDEPDWDAIADEERDRRIYGDREDW